MSTTFFLRRPLLLAAVLPALLSSAFLLSACQDDDDDNPAMPPATSDQRIVESFIEAMESRDSTAAFALIDPAATTSIRMTFSGAPVPQPVYRGRAASIGYLRGLFQLFTQTRWTNKVFTPAADGSLVFFEGTGDFRTRQGNRPYTNTYVVRFTLRDNRIIDVQEYYNPVTIFTTFGGPPLGQ